MKLMRKILLGLGVVIAIIALTIVLFFRQEAYQLYKVVTFFDAGAISENFRGVKEIFPTTTVPKPEQSNPFPMSPESYALIENFQVHDSAVVTKAFLDQTLTDALIIIQHDTI
ncbi:MAG: hypothetical protein ACK5WF_03840, partial [Cyclobacteriaceae bacterium]